KALLATQSADKDPEAWQTLAEANLRLSRVKGVRADERDTLVKAGLDAIQKALAVNPNHALALATQGALYLVRAHGAREAGVRRAAANEAVMALETALEKDAIISHEYAPQLQAARALAGTLKQPTP